MLIKKTSNGFVLFLHVQPGAKKSEIVGKHGDRLKVKIKAPPIDGKANQEVLYFFNQLLKDAPCQLTLIKGEKSRRKDLLIETSTNLETIKKLLNLRSAS